jgi:DNA-binding transcriptional regulator YiaG
MRALNISEEFLKHQMAAVDGAAGTDDEYAETMRGFRMELAMAVGTMIAEAGTFEAYSEFLAYFSSAVLYTQRQQAVSIAVPSHVRLSPQRAETPIEPAPALPTSGPARKKLYLQLPLEATLGPLYMNRKEIEDARNALALRQLDVANAIGIPQNYISELERGVMVGTDLMYEQLRRVLKKPLEGAHG